MASRTNHKLKEALEENEQLEGKLQEFQQQLDEANEFKNAIQDEAFENMSDGRWNPEAASRTRSNISYLQRRIRDWAQGNALPSLAALESLSSRNQKRLVKHLSAFVRLTRDGTLPDNLQLPALRERATALLLSAALAHVVVQWAFLNPFLCLDSQAKDLASKPSAVLQKSYAHGLGGTLEFSSELPAWTFPQFLYSSCDS